jgi:hypothetical protein
MGYKITAIEGYCKVPLANIRLVSLYVPAEVDTEPTPGLGVYSAQEPELVPGAAPILIPFDKFSCQLSSNPDTAQPGDFWSHQVRGGLRRNRAEVGLWMLRMRNRQFHLLTEDWYGERMWFPLMRLSASRTHEPRLNGVNGFTFTFSRRDKHPGIYLGTNPDAPISAEGRPVAWTDTAGERMETAGPISDFNP